jgi:hypothetical protein
MGKTNDKMAVLQQRKTVQLSNFLKNSVSIIKNGGLSLVVLQLCLWICKLLSFPLPPSPQIKKKHDNRKLLEDDGSFGGSLKVLMIKD